MFDMVFYSFQPSLQFHLLSQKRLRLSLHLFSYAGTREERGFIAMQKEMTDDLDANDVKVPEKKSVYDLPFGMKFLNKFKLFSYIPCLPQYTERPCCSSSKDCQEEEKTQL